jgi:hypothetical protein
MAEESPIHLPLGTFHESAGQNYRMRNAEAGSVTLSGMGKIYNQIILREKFRVNITDDVTDIR